LDVDLTDPGAIEEATAGAAPGPALGERVRRLRRDRSWTLAQASRSTGLSLSALSKIERGDLSPTLSSLNKIAAGFGIDVATLVKGDSPATAAGRRSITRRRGGDSLATATCRNTWLATDLRNKRMLPIQTTVTARDPGEYAEWACHPGEIFVYVLSGTLVVHSTAYVPVRLETGDSMYYDAATGTKWTSEGAEDAIVLWVYA
jgi:transcriptional regulator with XRE-family HTH domain